MPASRPAGPLSVPAFRRVWVGNTISVAGDAASWIALVSLSLTVANARLPVLVALYTAPVAVGGLAAGWALDHFDRRKLMIFDSVVRAGVFASIPIADIFAATSAAQLYGVAAVYGLLKMISLAGFPSLIPSLVSASQIERANALEGTTFGLSSLIGAMMAGLGVATIGAANVVTADAISYLFFAASLLSIRKLMPVPVPSPKPAPSGSKTSHGFGAVARMVVGNPVLRNTTIMFACFNVGEGIMLVFLPHRAMTLGLGPGGYGYLVAASTSGEVVAGTLLATRSWKAPLAASIIVAQLASAVVVTLLIIDSAAVTMLSLVAVGFASAPMTVWAQTLRMRLVPAEAHGRLFALLRTAMQATPPLGAGLAAALRGGGAVGTVLVVSAMIGIPAALLGPALLRSRLDDRVKGSRRAEQTAVTAEGASGDLGDGRSA